MAEDSIFRIVVPDSENLLREYLKQKDAGDGARADFAFTSFLDQCVRLKRGGKLGEYLEQIASGERRELKAYAEYVYGYDIPAASNDSSGKFNARKFLDLASHPTQIWSKLEPYYIKFISAFLPRAFREQNVSFAGVGERHLWMYDFASLRTQLRDAGFSRVERVDFNTSLRKDHPFAPLDELGGQPRKGSLQLFVEAQL
jgi:hypothetical protein